MNEKSFEDWAKKWLEVLEDDNKPYSEAREHLAREIMMTAIRHVSRLGFTMRVATNSGAQAQVKPLLVADNIYFYHPKKRKK